MVSSTRGTRGRQSQDHRTAGAGRENPVAWYSYSHCSPMIVHFHLGRSHAPVDVACFYQTIEIDGRIVYDEEGS